MRALSGDLRERIVAAASAGGRTDVMAVTTKPTRLYARSPRGTRVVGRVPNRWDTSGVVSAVRADGPFAAAVLPRASDTESFLLWVTNVLCPGLRRGGVVYLEDVRFHHRAEVRAAVRAAGRAVRSVPPYSPDLTPIERMWLEVKTALRAAGARTRAAVHAALPAAFAAVTAADVLGWFSHSFPHILP